MANFNIVIKSRRLYNTNNEIQTQFEVFDAVLHCYFNDDVDDNTNDFDVELSTDTTRRKCDTNLDGSLDYQGNEKGNIEYPGTIQNGTTNKFDANNNYWSVDELKGMWAYFYEDGNMSGSWVEIKSNTERVITTVTNIPANANMLTITDRNSFRHNIQVIPQAGLYGSFVQYEITKKAPVNGLFDWFGANLHIVPQRGLGTGFYVGGGSNSGGWNV